MNLNPYIKKLQQIIKLIFNKMKKLKQINNLKIPLTLNLIINQIQKISQKMNLLMKRNPK